MKLLGVVVILACAYWTGASKPGTTQEDAFYNSLSPEERKMIFGLAISETNFEDMVQQLRVPSLIEKLKTREIPPKFQENVITWMKETFNLGPENLVELRTNLKTCNTISCFGFDDMANRCCPFG